LPRREVEIDAGTHLAEVLGCTRILVNSLHFHAVSEAGEGLRIVARAGRGAAQAIEHPARPFWIGVQWHPEYLPQQRVHQQLFQALVACARSACQPHAAQLEVQRRSAV
jgi:putative glutamine amidotransferase